MLLVFFNRVPFWFQVYANVPFQNFFHFYVESIVSRIKSTFEHNVNLIINEYFSEINRPRNKVFSQIAWAIYCLS